MKLVCEVCEKLVDKVSSVKINADNDMVCAPCKNSILRRHLCDRNDSWWENDARGIPLCRVCDQCQEAKLSQYRPEILSGYSQADVDEPIYEDDWS